MPGMSAGAVSLVSMSPSPVMSCQSASLGLPSLVSCRSGWPGSTPVSRTATTTPWPSPCRALNWGTRISPAVMSREAPGSSLTWGCGSPAMISGRVSSPRSRCSGRSAAAAATSGPSARCDAAAASRRAMTKSLSSYCARTWPPAARTASARAPAWPRWVAKSTMRVPLRPARGRPARGRSNTGKSEAPRLARAGALRGRARMVSTARSLAPHSKPRLRKVPLLVVVMCTRSVN